jgi:diguanylate cyclase (GGDEF)-like protein
MEINKASSLILSSTLNGVPSDAHTMRPTQLLLPLIDYFIPADYRSEEVRLLRARIFVSTLGVLLCLIVLVDAFNFFWSDMSSFNKLISVGITVPIAAVSILCAFLFKQFSAYHLAVHIILFVQLTAIAFAVCISGGPLQSTATFLLFIPPMFAFCLAGTSSGVFWVTISFVIMSTGAMLDINGMSFPNVVEASMRKKNDLLNLNVGFISLTMIIGIYEFNSRRLNQSLRLQRSRFEYLANHDALTGLPNRLSFYKRCDEVIARCSRHSSGFALAYIDLDGFKPVNDKYGHRAGDITLVTIAQRLQKLIRKNDFLCRLGGDEFAFVFEDATSLEAIDNIIQRLHQTLALPISIDEGAIVVNASVGVATYPADGNNVEQLCNHADQCMYRDKLNHRSGRHQNQPSQPRH